MLMLRFQEINISYWERCDLWAGRFWIGLGSSRTGSSHMHCTRQSRPIKQNPASQSNRVSCHPPGPSRRWRPSAPRWWSAPEEPRCLSRYEQPNVRLLIPSLISSWFCSLLIRFLCSVVCRGQFQRIRLAFFSTDIVGEKPILVRSSSKFFVQSHNFQFFSSSFFLSPPIHHYWFDVQVRDFIRSALYDPNHGYFSKRSGPVGVLDRSIRFNQLEGTYLELFSSFSLLFPRKYLNLYTGKKEYFSLIMF